VVKLHALCEILVGLRRMTATRILAPSGAIDQRWRVFNVDPIHGGLLQRRPAAAYADEDWNVARGTSAADDWWFAMSPSGHAAEQGSHGILFSPAGINVNDPSSWLHDLALDLNSLRPLHQTMPGGRYA
jgi:hypothetical protein